MPGKVQNPDSWFYNVRVQAGFRNAATLAEQLGVPKGTVYQWERGSASSVPSHRPPWRLMPQIAEILVVTLPQLVEALWKETVGDPCPCGCGGTKAFPKDRLEARTLAIEIPCAKCGVKRIHNRWKKGRHRKLCFTCAASVERIKFTCIGYRDHDAKGLYAKTCPKTMWLRPSDVNARQRLKDNGLKSSFDASSKTYKCNSCAGTERLHAKQEKMIQEFLKEKYPDVDRKIRTGAKRRRMWSLHGAEINPKFKPTRDAQELGRRKFIQNAAAGMKYPKKTTANLIRRWLAAKLPECIRFGICIACDTLIMTANSENPTFHRVCHNKWESTPEGKNFQSRRSRGEKALLAITKNRGPRVAESNLKEAYSWAIGYYLRGFSFDEIASQNNLSPKAVEKRVKYIIARLPAPHLLAARFQGAIKLLLDRSRITHSSLAASVNF